MRGRYGALTWALRCVVPRRTRARQGARKEAGVIDSVFKRLMDFKRRSQQFRYGVGIIDSIVAKYFATIVGFWVVSRPFLALADASIGADSSGLRGGSHSTLMEDYYTSGRMLLNMSSAVRAVPRRSPRVSPPLRCPLLLSLPVTVTILLTWCMLVVLIFL